MKESERLKELRKIIDTIINLHLLKYPEEKLPEDLLELFENEVRYDEYKKYEL